MIQSTRTKIVAITPPAAIVDNASFTTAAVDTKGFDYATIYVLLGATDVAMTALKVQEGEQSNMSDAADVSGLNYATNGTLPSATDDNKIFAFDIDLRGRMRYLDVVATGGDGTTGTYLTAWVELSRAAEVPTTATERGLAATLRA